MCLNQWGIRRWVPGAALAAMVLGAAACGSDAASATSTTSAATTLATTATTAPSAATSTQPATTVPPAADGRVRHPAGASFALPDGWEVVAAVIATEFSATAECVSARIIDETLVEGGPGPSLYQAVFQVCSQPADGEGLEAFMDRTYGQDRAGFEKTVIADRDAYRSEQGAVTLIFVANDAAIFQILMSVETDPEIQKLRVQQVSEVLDSLTIA